MHKKDVGMAILMVMKGCILREMQPVSDAERAA
jgi:hypothetical protein